MSEGCERRDTEALLSEEAKKKIREQDNHRKPEPEEPRVHDATAHTPPADRAETENEFLVLVQARIIALEDEITFLQLEIERLERQCIRRAEQLEALWKYHASEERLQGRRQEWRREAGAEGRR
jgi:hypothetical protein